MPVIVLHRCNPARPLPAVVSTIDVKGVGPADAPDKGYTLRFTEAEIVKKVADLIDTML